MSQGFTNNSIVNNPVGSMQMFAGATAPSGYLICDGAELSRSTYSKLFEVIGESFGAGDSATTFNIPDMRGTSPQGVGTSSGYTSNETVALGIKYDDQMQGHKHASHAYSGGSILGFQVFDTAIGSQDVNYATALPCDDGTNGTPRTGLVTKGKTVGINFIIKT